MSDSDSEIIDFYPIDFRLDVNGARYAWMGVNLLPFIDRQRLCKAMKKADGGGARLSQEERARNQTGQIMLFFAREEQSQSALAQTLASKISGAIELVSSYHRRDLISGRVKVMKVRPEERSQEAVHRIVFEHPTYQRHITKLLEGVEHAPKEVEEFEIYHVNRRFFNGEGAVRMSERVLGIDTSLAASYKPLGFVNNHSEYTQAREPRRGQSIEQYNQSLLGKRAAREFETREAGSQQKRQEQNSSYGYQYAAYQQ